MTFLDKYNQETSWQNKAILMEIYHLVQTKRIQGWTMGNTADYFEVSIGLVSENLKLARAIVHNNKVAEMNSRQDALRKLRYG